MWCRGTLSSPAHRKFASSVETEVHTGVIARSRGSTVRPGRASENRSGRLLIAYSTYNITVDDVILFLELLSDQLVSKMSVT